MTNQDERMRPAQGPHHGVESPRGLTSVARSALFQGRFGRMFRNLPPFAPADNDLAALAETMLDADDTDETLDNKRIDAGFTYFGQFIDHDMTFDPVSRLQRDNDPDALVDFRTPRFDLDSLYGRGPADNPFLYDADGLKLLVGQNRQGEMDLPRNNLGRALIGDPRNDENLIVSQLHLAIIRYHNAVVDQLIRDNVPRQQLFADAQGNVRWHYQWLVINDFLRKIVGSPVVDNILRTSPSLGAAADSPAPGRYVIWTNNAAQTVTMPTVDLKFFHWKNQPFIPVEFAVAAYRFGHSMVRIDYTLNGGGVEDIPIFSTAADAKGDLHGFRVRPAGREIEWSRFFTFHPESDALIAKQKFEPTRTIDTVLSKGLQVLPDAVIGGSDTDDPELVGHVELDRHSLAARNLLRGKALGLPTGQAVARAMAIPEHLILTHTDLRTALKDQQARLTGLSDEQRADVPGPFLTLPDQKIKRLVAAFGDRLPLWYYILLEAQMHNPGRALGPVGGRIVAEVLIGLLSGDPSSYLRVQPAWQPEAGRFGARADGAFAMTDLLRFAGVKIKATNVA